MGSGSATKHQSYVVTPAGKPDEPIVVPVTELPFLSSPGEEPPPPLWEGVENGIAWSAAGFGPGGAIAYSEAGITDPTSAKAFYEKGMGPDEAGEWQKAGFDPYGASSWGSNGFLPVEAQAHMLAGHTPLDALVANAESLGAKSTPKLGPVADMKQVDASAAEAGVLAEPAVCPNCGAAYMAAELPDGFVCGVCGWNAKVLVEDDPAVIAASNLSSAELVESAAEAGLLEDAEPAAETTVPGYSDVAPATTLAAAGKVSEQAWHEAVTPIPDEVPLGDPRGVPLLIGGADLEKGSATIMAYEDPHGGPAHEVLFCTIDQAAEAKLLDALAPTEQKLIPVEVTKSVTGRLAVDEEGAIFDDMVTAAKSISTHLKDGTSIPAHTIERVEKLKGQMEQLAGDEFKGNSGVQQMVAKYAPLVEAMAERTAADYAVAYEAGGKVPMITPFETTWEKTEIEYVPDLSEPTGEAKLTASARTASRVDPTIASGRTQWDGKKRTQGKGIEYVIQLADGYQAVYHPYVYQGQNLAQDHFSLRGHLEIHCPGGEGHAKQLVDVLGSLNIVNRPMNGAEAEWTYLQQNIVAQGLDKNPAVKKSIESSGDLEANVGQQLMLNHAHEAIGMDLKQIDALAQRLTLEAEASALPLRVRMVRDAVAKAVGVGTGQDLAGHPAYQPMPRRSGGWMVFDRFDVARNEVELGQMFKSKKVMVHITGQGSAGSSILDIFRNGGVLASTERRRVMGASKGVGMSEHADMQTGGAKSTFVRLFENSAGESKARIVWDDPLTLLRRADWYGNPHDSFGSENSASGHSTAAKTTDLKKVVSFSGNNELMFRDGLDLLGADAPSRVLCSSAAERDAIRKLLKGQGITKLGGKPVDAVIVVP